MDTKVLRWLNYHVEELFLSVLLLTLITLTSASMVLRYMFSSSLAWNDEIYKHCPIFSGFININYWIRHKSGICVDALAQVVPRSVKTIFQVLVQLIVLVFLLLMLKGAISCWLAIKKSGQVSGTLQAPTIYAYVAPTIGFDLMFLREVQNLVLGFVQRKKRGNEQ